MAESFSANTDLIKIGIKSIIVEYVNDMTNIECYHCPIRRKFNIIRKEAPELDAEATLQMAVKYVDD